jgi:hypothetical protein
MRLVSSKQPLKLHSHGKVGLPVGFSSVLQNILWMTVDDGSCGW